MARPILVGRHLDSFARTDGAKLRADIVRVASVVTVDGAWAVADVRGVDFVDGFVAGELEVIGPDSGNY
jgi:hypothetical protein